jgi:hypothetical protein
LTSLAFYRGRGRFSTTLFITRVELGRRTPVRVEILRAFGGEIEE